VGRVWRRHEQRGRPLNAIVRLHVEIRPAAPSEAAALSSLALEAKAHWGYSGETLESWKGQLEVSPSNLASKPTYVGSIDENVVGFYSLVPSGSTWELDNLWVAPQFMNRGLGRLLLAHALEVAFRGGASSVTVDADPNAEPFYLSCGAIRCGEVPAPISGQPNRVRPQLAFNGRAT
jgi:ribosomal protein S18 acetylase RimI-like enzyme